MTLEEIINPAKIEKTKFGLFLIGLIFSSIAILLSWWVFKPYAGIVAVFLTVIALTPYIYYSVKNEEILDESDEDEKSLLKSHFIALKHFMYIFFGIVISIALWYVALGPELSNTIFKIQIDTINNINMLSGNAIRPSSFHLILLNNIKVLMFCFLFSLVYGVGAMFILTWNASIIGVAIGKFISSNIQLIAGTITFGNYFQIVFCGLFIKYAIHGIPEILSFFTAGLAGGIISIGVMKQDFRSKNFSKLLLDVSDLIIIAFVLVTAAAVLEIYVTPHIFSGVCS